MAKTKQRPSVGDSAWFVEWCETLSYYDDDPDNGVDRDSCKMKRRRTESKEEAERLAREVYPLAAEGFGYVEYWPATFVAYDDDDAEKHPHVGFWEVTADPECFEGDEETP